MTFDHCEPTFEESKNSVGSFVGDEVDPGVSGGLVIECDNIFRVAEGDWVDGATDVRENSEKWNCRFVGKLNC